MNKNIAYVFPETLPDKGLLSSLVPVFDQVVYLQAVENDPAEQEVGSGFVEQCCQAGRLRSWIPAPLGEQRERFLALVNDMRRSGAEYISQLGMLALAGLHHDHRSESKHAILAALQGQNNSEHEEREMLLWQSRLVLKLAELYDVQQAEINEALGRIAARQDTLLAELRDEEEDTPFSLTTSLHEIGQETDTTLLHRLKAWSRLCLHDPEQPQGLLVTSDQQVFALLQDTYEHGHHQSPRWSASLELPMHDGGSWKEKATIDEPCSTLCPNLQQALRMLAPSSTTAPAPEETVKQLLTESAAQWTQCLDNRYPKNLVGRCTLDFYYFPDSSARHLLRDGFVEKRRSAGRVDGPSANGCFIGLLRRDGRR